MTVVASVVDRGYEVVERGLIVTRALSYNEWQSLGRSLTKLRNKVQWAVGDWLAYGAVASEFRDYDDFYHHVVQITGRSYASIAHVVRVSQEFPIGDRLFNLPWSHYREILQLPETDRPIALRASEMNKWSRRELTEYIATRLNGASPELPQTAVTDVEELRARRVRRYAAQQRDNAVVQCPSCGHTFEPRTRKA